MAAFRRWRDRLTEAGVADNAFERIEEMMRTPPSRDEIVKHIDRCLSCLSCMTTCPSGVHYMHLVDHGRHHIEERFRRPLPDPLSTTAPPTFSVVITAN